MKNDELEDFSKIYEEEQKQNNIEKFYIKKKKISELSQIQNYNQKANTQKSQQQKEQVMISEVHTLLSEGTIAVKYLPWKYFFCFMIVLGVQTCSSIVFEDYFSLFLELLLFCVSPLHYFEQQPKRRTLILYTWSALISLEAIQQFRLNKPFIFHLLMMLTCLLILNQLYSLIRYYKQITKSLTPPTQAIQDQLD